MRQWMKRFRLRSIKKYLVLTEVAFQAAMAYRVRFFTSLLSGLVQVLILYYIWHVVYGAREQLNGFTHPQMVTYILISYAVGNLYGFYAELSISASIRDGSVATALIRPLDYQLACFFESLGNVVLEGSLIALIVLALGFGVFKIDLPPDMVAALFFCASLVLSLLVNFASGYIAGLVSFWTTGIFGFVNAKRFVSGFFSGALVPLAFFPDWLRTVALWLPFHATVHLPVSIYLGQTKGVDAVRALLVQIVWVIVLWSAGRLLWSQAAKKVTIHGG